MWKGYTWNPSTYSCGNGKYLASIMGNLTITCEAKPNDEAKSNDKETKANFNKKSSLQNT